MSRRKHIHPQFLKLVLLPGPRVIGSESEQDVYFRPLCGIVRDATIVNGETPHGAALKVVERVIPKRVMSTFNSTALYQSAPRYDRSLTLDLFLSLTITTTINTHILTPTDLVHSGLWSWDRDSPARDYPKPWLDFLYERCLRENDV